MRTSVTLLERDGRSAVPDCISFLLCSKRPDGAFLLWLTETSDLGRVRRIVARQVRTPGEFIDAVLSVNDGTELKLDCETIRDAMCAPLARLDPDFAIFVGHLAQTRITRTDPRAA
jgi:hypothetical protein